MPHGRMDSTLARTLSLAALGGIVALLLFGAAASQASPRCDHRSGSSAPDGLNGGAGSDCLRGGAGADSLAGGRGNDKLTGGVGADQLLAGPGHDSVRAGPGNDLVSAQDGVAERIDCGPGNDLASVDASDVLTGCEKVHLTAPVEQWKEFTTHINAYGYTPYGRTGWGSCSGNTSARATCNGKAEAGTNPFHSGSMSMEWDKRADGAIGQDVTIKAGGADATLLGYSDRGWIYVGLNGGRVPAWVNPNDGIFRTGTDIGKTGKQGGPLRADLSWHGAGLGQLAGKADGYSLDLQGWLRIIRF
jgi:Ca2+-binding RTX toxin-like protein